MRTFLAAFFLITGFLPASHLRAQRLPEASPEAVGLSSERLQRIDETFQTHVSEGHIAGAVGMVIRDGKVAYLSQWGMRDREAGDPLEPDDIFRIYSMTKPITSVAVMMLFEEGRFFLNDPVGRYLPELRGLEVALLEEATSTENLPTEGVNRPVTIQDLLRHTSGFTYGVFSNTPVDTLYREANVLGQRTLAEMVSALGGIPLMFQPGTRWYYSVSTDVLARLVEVVSGMRFDRFLETRIFEPLGMSDTGFHVPPEKLHRFARTYRHAGPSRALALGDTSSFMRPPTFLSGGGGLVSTAADYARFTQMLLNGGELDGVSILGRKTVELMTSDHLGDVPGPGAGTGFGLGFAVKEIAGLNGTASSVGEYNWGGLHGTSFWIDPEEDLIGIFMVQIYPNQSIDFRGQFKNLVYQALTVPEAG
jgi:CubicO group peptidase (beta-lactamase class C family)